MVTGAVLVIVATWAYGLIDLYRKRHERSKTQSVLWAGAIVFFALFGLLAYMVWDNGQQEQPDFTDSS